MRQLLLCVIVGAAALVGGVSAWAQAPGPRPGKLVEVIVELHEPPAARTPQSRAASSRRLAAAQRRLEARLVAAIPSLDVRWRYRLVLNGLALVIPAGAVATVAEVRGVASVHASVGYGPSLNASPLVIGAPTLWAPDLANGGRGIKIGVIDDGIDMRSPLFDAAGFEMPDGFPRGDTRFTSAKVIVARAFAPPNASVKAARLPFDRKRSGHGTHVAGIAAGNAGVVPPRIADRPVLPLSGVAPLAYLGNYRAMTIPTASGVGLNGNSPEIVAAIEAAVADGMDVINLSLGQPEVAPERDLVAKALDNAAALGVIPVVSAGNEYLELGLGSVASPGTAASAITVGAVSNPRVFGVVARVLNTASPTLGSMGLYPVPGTGAAGLTGAVFAATASPDDASYCMNAPAVPQQMNVIGTVAVASGDGCSLVRKARNAAASGAAALLVSSSQTDLFRARPDSPPIPIFVAPAAVAAELSSAIALEQKPLALEITDTPRAVLTGFSPRVASFSASGPTPLGLGLKPDIVAPGVNILSSFPVRDGGFGLLSGTSMATPHVSGAAALLRELHPDWTVAQLKSALVLTGRPVELRDGEEAPPTRAGSGLVDLPTAATPRIFSFPTGISFGLVSPGDTPAEHLLALADAGGGGGEWSVRITGARGDSGVSVSVPATVVVPGTLAVQVNATPRAELGERSGFIVLSQGNAERRIPYWLRVSQPALELTGSGTIRKTGTYRGTTAGGTNRVDRYRYPERPWAAAFRGPEQVFRLKLARPVANVGVAIVKRGAGVGVEPRIVIDGDENRLAGSGSLPFVSNPYQVTLGGKTLSAAVVRPAPGNYTVVFDSRSPNDAGWFQFRFWIDDTTPPSIRLVSRKSRDGTLRVRVRDRGSGVDPRSISYRIDRSGFTPADWDRKRREAIVDTTGLRPGRHTLLIRAADRQEAKNTENVGPILPNTQSITATFTVPRTS